MNKRLFLSALLAAAVSLTACGAQGNTAPATETTAPAETTAAETTAEVTEEETTEEVTEPPTNAPLPEADPNACTFDEVGADVAVLVVDDKQAVNGTLSIAELDGNKMLKLTDETSNADNFTDAVQKIRFDVSKLLAQDQLALVDRIEFDLYAEARDTLYVNEDGENMMAPGWIGGGGGTECSDGKWYGFADFSGSNIQEYWLPRTDACHVTFKFLLAASGKKWDNTMTQPYLQIMRWGIGNISDTYIDNITFYDADGNSIPLTISDGWADFVPPAAEETETEAAPAESTEETAETATAEEAAE
ncbi:MAG: hypothetical protein IJ906_02785 [Oscillospiraceae bacterium]|nr:hypothetical protein [Oscillospiraceae bacterium]